MPGRLRRDLQFSTAAGLAVDFVLTAGGASVVRTTDQYRLNFAPLGRRRGFVLSVGAGILTPADDGPVQVRVASTDVPPLVGDFEISLQRLASGGDWVTWATGGASIGTGAYDRALGGAPVGSGPDAAGAVTVTVDWSDNGTITVDAAPGVAGESYLLPLIQRGAFGLGPGASDDDFVAALTAAVETATMASKTFDQQSVTLPTGQTWTSPDWRDTGADPGALSAIGSVGSAIATDQTIQAHMDWGPDGAAALGSSRPVDIIANKGEQEFSVSRRGRYARTVVTNNSGQTAHFTATDFFGR